MQGKWWDKNKTIMKKFNYSGSCKYMAYFIYFLYKYIWIKKLFEKIQKYSLKNNKKLYLQYQNN